MKNHRNETDKKRNDLRNEEVVSLYIKSAKRYGSEKNFYDSNVGTYKLFKVWVKYTFSAVSIFTGMLFFGSKLAPVTTTFMSYPVGLGLAVFIESLKYYAAPKTFEHFVNKHLPKALAFTWVLVGLFAISVTASVSFIKKYAESMDADVVAVDNQYRDQSAALKHEVDSLLHLNDVAMADLINMSNDNSKQTTDIQSIIADIEKLTKEISYIEYTKRNKVSKALQDSTQRYADGVASYYDSQIRSKHSLLDAKQSSISFASTQASNTGGQYSQRMEVLKGERQRITENYERALAKLTEDNQKNMEGVTGEHTNDVNNITLISLFIELMILISLIYCEWFMWRLSKEEIDKLVKI